MIIESISIDLPGFGRSDKPLKKEFFNFTIIEILY